MPSYMYILECVDGSYYTGSTKDLDRRLWQHQNGEGANFTKKRLPVKLVYAEPFDRVEDAFRREKQIQGWSRRKKKALIEGNYDKLIEFSRNYTQYGDPASADPAAAADPVVAYAHQRPLGPARVAIGARTAASGRTVATARRPRRLRRRGPGTRT